MKAMILAAGRGQRMMPLTRDCAKPMLRVNDKPLIQYHIERLAQAGITEIVINLAWQGESISDYLGDGRQFGVTITYSQEPEAGLETAGGIIHALDELSEQFIVVNGDVFTDYDFCALTQLQLLPHQAHLVLIENPPHNPEGDFALVQGNAKSEGECKHTFSGIGLYHKCFFEQAAPGFVPLAPLLRRAMEDQLVSAELYLGQWHDIGTPQRLAQINEEYCNVG